MSLPSRQLSRVHGDTFALGKKFRVVAPTVKEATQNSEAVYALLKVYGEPGNPYAPIESYLRPNDEIRCTGFKNFNGQTWVMFLCDESKAGVYLADAPREPYWAWAPQDLLGKRWLMCLDARTLADAVAVEPGSLVPPSEVLSTSQGVLQEYDGDNLYAKILRGDIASYKVLETDYALAMLYEFPEAPFHVVLVPKAPSMGADDLDKVQAAGVFKVWRASGSAGAAWAFIGCAWACRVKRPLSLSLSLCCVQKEGAAPAHGGGASGLGGGRRARHHRGGPPLRPAQALGPAHPDSHRARPRRGQRARGRPNRNGRGQGRRQGEGRHGPGR